MNPKPDKTIPAIYGGLVMGLISAIPFLSILNCFCCAGVMLGGFLAVYFYKNEFTPDTPPFTSGDCVAVGALAGVMGAVIGTALSLFILMVFGNVTRQILLGILHNLNLNLPQELWDKIEESLNEGLTFFKIIADLFGSLVIDTIFGLLGGLIAYSIYKPKPQLMPPPPPPPAQLIQ